MATKKTSSSSGGKTSAPKKTSSRPAPAKKVPVQSAPHSRTIANGQPRPKRRG